MYKKNVSFNIRLHCCLCPQVQISPTQHKSDPHHFHYEDPGNGPSISRHGLCLGKCWFFENDSKNPWLTSQQCFDHDEHFTTNHAQLAQGGDPNNQFGYCPSANGCCADGKTWYACKRVSPASRRLCEKRTNSWQKCAGGAACSVSGGQTSC